jgi:murein DD-endopeptidase MepM/ murein hydrolase activator NlpD
VDGGDSEHSSSARGPSPETPTVTAVDTTGPSPRALHGASATAAISATPGQGRKGGREALSRVRAALAIAGGAALLGAAAVLMASAGGLKPAVRVTGAPLAGSVSGVEALLDDASAEASVEAQLDAGPESGTGWRIGRLAGDPTVTLVEGVMEHRPLLVALTAAGLPNGEAQRIAGSLSEVRSLDRIGPKDAFTVARDRSGGHVVAYELAGSPTDVWQGREEPQPDGSQKLTARKLGLFPEPVRVRKAVLVGADLRASIADAGLGPVDDVLTMLDDALEGHAELSEIRPGARLRIVGTQERVDGVFIRWLSLDAVEYFPAAATATSVRVYEFGDDQAAKKHHGWYDAKGKQPVRGGWRMPVPLARIASRFNPHRMHPVLHVIMPHNGVDLAAPAGAPVYATASGVVSSVGFDGPCGNKVEIAHPHGMTSVYCHLSRFATGLRVGQHVEQRQLIAYVGQTGRVTGPHLHFGIRRGDVFIDPLTLRLDGVRVVPREKRDNFDRLRADLDAELDTIPLPAPNGSPQETEPETIYEESP